MKRVISCFLRILLLYRKWVQERRKQLWKMYMMTEIFRRLICRSRPMYLMTDRRRCRFAPSRCRSRSGREKMGLAGMGCSIFWIWKYHRSLLAGGINLLHFICNQRMIGGVPFPHLFGPKRCVAAHSLFQSFIGYSLYIVCILYNIYSFCKAIHVSLHISADTYW